MSTFDDIPASRPLPGRVAGAVMAEVRAAPDPAPRRAGRGLHRTRRASWRPIGTRRGLAILVAGAVVLAGGGAAAYTLFREAVPVEGAFNPGGPLHCTGIELLAPAQVESKLRARGYEVVWQYETDGGPIASQPPPGAVIVDVAVTGGTAIVVAENFDPTDPLHERRRAGQPQVPCEK